MSKHISEGLRQRPLAKSFKVTERYNLVNLKKICKIEDFGFLAPTEDDRVPIKQNLERILKHVKCGELNKELVQRDGIGRYYYPKGKESYGILYLQNVIRGFILEEGTRDLDIKNCHPTILAKIIKDNNLVCKELNEFINDRESTMTKYSFDKESLLTMINYPRFPTTNQFLTNIKKVIYEGLYPILKEKHSELFKFCQRTAPMNKKTIEGSFISRVLQEAEQDIMFYALNFFKFKGVPIGCVIFDGVHIYNGDDYVNQGLLSELETYVKTNTGFEVKFVVKEFPKPDQILEVLKKMDESADKVYIEWKEDWEKHHFYMLQNKGEIVSDFYEDLHIYSSPVFVISKYMYNTRDFPNFDEALFKRWAQDPKKRTYYKFDFHPYPSVCPDDCYNTWKGFARDLIPDANDSDERKNEVWEIYKEFYSHLASGDEALVDYMIQYDAHVLQYPGIKPGVCTVFTGEQGSGKGTWALLHEGLIGREYFAMYSDIDMVVGKFTSGLSRKLIIVLDEAISFQMFEKSNALKSLITETTHKIERKGQDAFTEHSYIRFVTNTNDENPVKVSNTDRRHIIIKTTKIPEALAVKMYKLLGSDSDLQTLFRLLKEIEVKYITLNEWQHNRPITKAYKELKSNCGPTYYSFLHKFVSDRDQETLNFVENGKLMAAYQMFCTRELKTAIPTNTFFKKIAEVDGVTKPRTNAKRGKNIDKVKVLTWLTSKGFDYLDFTDALDEPMDSKVEEDDK